MLNLVNYCGAFVGFKIEQEVYEGIRDVRNDDTETNW